MRQKINSMNTNIPMLKKRVLDDQLNIAIEKPLKEELRSLKSKHNVDYNEWIRGLIRQELPNIKKKIGA